MNRILRQFLIVCAVVLFLSVFMAFSLRDRALDAMEDKCTDLAQAQMARISEKLDTLLEHALNLGRQLAHNDTILTLSSYSDPVLEPAAQIKSMEARDLLTTALTFNDRYLDILVYNSSSQLVVTSKYAFINYDRFYGTFFAYGDMDAEGWREDFLDVPYMSRIFPVIEIRTYVNYRIRLSTRCVPVGLSLQSGRGKILLLIPETEFPTQPEDLIPGYDCRMRIYDKDGTLLLGDSAPAGENDITLVTNSSSLGLSYELVVSALSIKKDLAGFGQILATMIISQLFLLLAFGALTAWQDVFPVKRLLSVLPVTEQTRPEKADYLSICNQVSALVERNAQLSSQLLSQTPITENWLTLDWLSGRFADEQALEQAFSRMRLTFPSALCWGLMVIGFSSQEVQVSSALETALLVLRKAKNDGLWFARTNDTHIAVLYGYQPGEEEAALSEISQIKEPITQLLKETYGTAPSFALHAPVLPHEIPAQLSALYSKQERSGTARNNESTHLRYSFAAEKRLINAVCNGNLQECQGIVCRLEEENEDADARARLCAALRLTQSRLLDTLEFPLNEPIAPQTDAEILSWFESACRQVQSAEGEEEDADAIHPIAIYILEHYDDKNMSLNLLSEHFGVSEAYLSRRFKEATGYNYTTFLEKVRIEHACDLLNNGMTIEAVADLVGYNSVHVFRSAFKRTMGVTPSNFRVPSGHGA